jgi:hypothetical protein
MAACKLTEAIKIQSDTIRRASVVDFVLGQKWSDFGELYGKGDNYQ